MTRCCSDGASGAGPELDDGSCGDEKGSHSGCILNVEPVGFPNPLKYFFPIIQNKNGGASYSMISSFQTLKPNFRGRGFKMAEQKDAKFTLSHDHIKNIRGHPHRTPTELQQKMLYNWGNKENLHKTR